MSLSKILYLLLKILVQPRKTGNRPDTTEKLLLGLSHKASILLKTGPYKDHSAKFGKPQPVVLHMNIFSCFPIYKAYVKHVTPRVGPFLAKGRNLNKPCRSPLDVAI